MNTIRQRQAAGDALPLPHRLAILYLMLPLVLWLVGWFRWWLGLPATALLALAFWPALSGSWRIRLRPATLAVLLTAAGWVMLTPAGGVFDAGNAQWRTHRTVLLDLGRYPWPTFLPDPLAAHAPAEYQPRLLRYYLGFYMPPGAVAHLLGPATLNWAVPLWTWCGVALLLILFTRRYRGWGVVTAVIVFIFFSGMDIVRLFADLAHRDGISIADWLRDLVRQPPIEGAPLSGETRTLSWLKNLARQSHIEWAGTRGLVAQYPSTMTALMWVPQHFIPAGLYTLLVLQLHAQRRFLAVSGPLLAAAPFWSAFVAIGLLPLLAVLGWKNGPRPLLRWPNLVLALPLAGLLVFYLSSSTGELLHGWMWEFRAVRVLWTSLPLFHLSEFLLLVLVLGALRPELRRDPFFLVSCGTLLLLPLYRFGVNNDLAMRGSLPALVVLSTCCAETVTGPLRARTGVPRLGLGLVAVLLIVGSSTACVELARAVRNQGMFRFEQARMTALVDFPKLFQQERTISPIPEALRWLLRENKSPSPESGELAIRSHFNIYLTQHHIIFMKEGCGEDDYAPFQLDLIPLDRSELPPSDQKRGFQDVGFRFDRVGREFGQACGVIRPLPPYALAAIRTGQPARGWAVHITMNADGSLSHAAEVPAEAAKTER